MSDLPGPEIWRPILQAVETEPQDLTSIRGASGIEHPLLAGGVDEGRRRLVLITGEADARSAALAHADIQAALPDLRVIVARPVAINPAAFADAVSDYVGLPELTSDFLSSVDSTDQEAVNAHLEPILTPVVGPFIEAIGPMGFMTAVSQALVLLKNIQASTETETDNESGEERVRFRLDLSNLTGMDPHADDRDLGLCPLPLYAFGAESLETLTSGDPEFARSLLTQHDALQYFFPAPDQLALGIIERSPGPAQEVIEGVALAAELGHPLGPMELVPQDTKLLDLLDALKDRKLAVQGEVTQELTPDGSAARATVRFAPKEGIVSKVLNRITVSLDITTRFFP